MKTTKYILTLMLTAWCALGNLYAVEKSYYNSVDGKSGSALREALTTLTYTKHTTDVGYNWTFDGIDIVNGEILDIYSNCSWTLSQQGKSYSNICDGYNREHIVPQSVFNEEQPQKSDRHHLFLADGLVNGLRSSYPFGETNVTTAFSGYSNGNKALGKLGTASSGYSGTVYEPDDEYKGDIARAVLYMAVRYATSDVCRKYGGSANSYPVTSWNNSMFSKNLSTNYGLSNNAITVFLKWHRNDPVSAKEIARNNGVEKKQGNRNPFIDLPDLVEYLWGNHVGETVDLSSLDIATGGGSVPTTYEITLNRNGATETATCTGTYTLPTASMEADACDGWAFAGWSTNSSVETTTAPSFTTSVSGATTLYAVYSNTTSSSAPIRKTNADVNDVLWGEDFSGFSANDVPSASNANTVVFSGSITYSVSNGGGTTKVYNENTGGGTAPEILIAKSNGTLTASGIPTGGATEMSLTFVSNKTTFSVTTESTALNIDGSGKSWTISVKSGQTSPETFDLTIKNTGSSNSRVDNIVLKVTTAGSGGGGSTTTYMTSPSCGDSHNITLSSGGSVTGGTFAANASSAYAGATITLFAEPLDGYTFGSWSVTAGGSPVSVTDNQFTMPDANVTVSATFNALPTFNINFYNNGAKIGSTQTVYQGGMPDVPVIESCEGYTFVGWWTAPLASDNTASKSWIEDFTATANKDYYAIFEHTETSGGSVTPTTVTETGSSSSPYVSLTGWSASAGGTYTSAGNYGDSSPSIKFSATNHYVQSETFSGAITAVSYWYKPQTATGSIAFYVSTNGTDFTELTSEKVSFSSSSTADTKSITLSASSGYKAIKLVYTKSTSNVAIDDISVTYNGGGGTTYYTSTTDCPSACTKLGTPVVTATPGNGQITLTWADVTDADHYTVTIGKGAGYTTECGSAASIGSITHSGTTNTCVVTGLTNGLTYTTNVVANASSSTCDSDADSDSATPQDCTPWDDPTLSWNKYSLNTTTDKTATKSLSGTTHGTLSFESSKTEVLSVNSTTGAVTAVGAGEATVIARWTAADGYCEKTMVSSTFEVAGPLTISFDANGGNGTMTDQTVTYNVSAAIKDNDFSREGYSFIGWATSADGEKVYNDKQSVAFTNSQTLYAKWQLNSHNVSFTPSPTGATVTVNGQSTNPQTAEYGATVTIQIAPAEHYTISSVSIQGATSHTEISQTGSGETRTFTMPDENVTVSVEMSAESQYTATFYNSGTQYGEAQTGYADDDISAPATNPEACDESFTFVGWVAAEQTSETTSKPEVLTFPQTMPAGNVSFYALYRRVEGSGGGEASVTFKTASSDQSAAYTDDSDIKTNLVESYSGIESFAGSKAYLGKSGVKLGASGGSGYITLNLSSPITTNTITVHAVNYGTDTGKLQAEVNGSNSFGEALSPADGTLTFSNASEVEISDLTISTTSKRAYVASISLGGGGTSYYTTAPECVPCDYQVTLTKGEASHGTFTLDKANGTYDNCKTNFIVTVSGITPAEGYYCSGVSATGGSHAIVAGPDGSGNYTVSYTKDNTIETTITAIFEEIPTYTVTWSSNGETTTQDYKEGEDIIFPPSVSGCEGKVFMGWSAVEVAEQDEAPEYTTSAVMGNSDLTYYAVFATASTGGGSAFDGTTGGTYKIYAQVGSTKYYATGTGSKISSTTNEAEATEYTFEEVSGGLAIKTGTTYITYSSNTNLGTSSTAYTWSFGSGTKGTWRVNSGTSGRAFVFRASTYNQFGGYATNNVTASGTEYYDLEISGSSSGGTTYSGYTTSCTECLTKVTIEKGVESHGEFTLNKADGEYNNCAANFVVVVSGITHESGYHCTGVTATGGHNTVTGPDGSGNYTVTYEKGYSIESTITANFEPNPTYTVTWSMDGDEDTKAYYEEGDEIVFPTSATGCDGKTFVGWSSETIAETDEVPTTFVTSATMGTSNLIFYAVFADVNEGSGSGEITKTTSIAVGDIVYLVYEEDSYELNGISTTSTKYGIGKSYTTTPEGLYPLEVVEGSSAGNVAFKNGSNYLNLGGNSNSLSSASSVTDNSSWIVTFNSGNAVITNVAIDSRTIRWNKTSGQERFACYTNNGQQPVQLYKQGAGASYSGYTTSCCSEVVAPKGIVVTAKSTSATISWTNQTGAVNGYSVVVKQGTDVVFEKNDIAAGVTSCSVTGLFATQEYNYTVVAKGETCTASTSGNFTTPDCEDVPYNIVATPTVSTARISWTAEAETATIRLYSDKSCDSELTESAKYGVSSPATIKDLLENTTYYFKIWANGTCVSAVDSFKTLTTSVEIAEWFADSIRIVLTADDSVQVIIEDKQEMVNVEENVADKLFFSKYFEADGNNKMIAIYNGTKDSIDITNMWLKHSQRGSAEAQICLKKFGKKPGVIAPDEEIIIMRFSSDTDGAIECAEKEDNYSEWNIINDTNKDDGEGNNIYEWLKQFSGPQSIGLYDGETSKFIDVIGATTNSEGTGSLVQIDASIKDPCSYTEKSTNDGSGFYAEGKEVGTDNDILLSTNRCLLIRKNTVKSGDNAIANNVYTPQESCDEYIGESFTTLGSEWVGYVIGKGDDAADKTCEGLAEVGGFDYQGYYAQYDSISTDTLGGKPNDDGTYTITIPRLDTLACSTLRISVYDRTTTEQKFTYEYKVPIMIQSGTTMTQDELFTKHDITTCKTCDVVVMENATLKKVDGDYNEIRNLILYPGSSFNLPEDAGDYTVQSLQFRVEGENAPVTKIQGNLISKDGLVTVTRRINNDDSYFFSLPYDCNLADVYWSTGEPMVQDQGVRIKEYDSQARANEGSGNGKPSHWKMVDKDATLKAGKGYQISVNSKYYKELVFPMEVGSTNLTTEENNKSSNEISIHKYEPTDKTATTKNNWNWNFIAHPYISAMTPSEGDAIKAGWLKYTEPENPGDEGIWEYEDGGNAYLTLWNPATSTYDQTIYNKSGLKLDPFVAFFVQGKAEGEFTFEKENRILSAPARHLAAKAENEDLSIFAGVTLSGNGQSDETAVRIRPDFTGDYDIGYDLEKFLVFYTERPQIYMKTTDSRLAFQAIDDYTATSSFLPVGVYCYEAGTYTFGLSSNYPIDEIEAVYLYDSATGITTNLLYDTYSITTTKQLYTNVRFSLNVVIRRKSTEVTTDLDAANAPEGVTRKVIINDHVYIQRGGVIYDMTGKQMLNH